MNDDKKKKDQKNQPPMKNPAFIFLIIAIIGTVIFNMAITSYTTKQQEEISYDEFLSMVRSDEVDEVIIQADKIMMYEKNPEEESVTTDDTNDLLKLFGVDVEGSIEKARKESRNVYYTGYLPDERLFTMLDEKGIKYYTPIAYNNPILDFYISNLPHSL